MMTWLGDTNILLRFRTPTDPQHKLVRDAVDAVKKRGETVYIAPQNLVEFWNAATRPIERNGFGLTPAQADAEVNHLEALFPLAQELPLIHAEWRHIVAAVGVSSVQVHDARLAAIMQVHGLTHILTLNTADFTRFPGITAVHPKEVLAQP